jgi:glycosyltransferase 2 family protein
MTGQIQEQVPDRPRIRFFRYLPLLVLGIAVILLLLNLSELSNILSVLRRMLLWLVGIAIIAQACSYLSSGYMLQSIMNSREFRISIGKGTLIAMAAESISLAGGFASSAAATYYWISKGDNASGKSMMAGILPGLYNEAVLILVTFFGMLYLIFNHELSKNQIIVYSVFLVIIVIVILLFIYALMHQAKIVDFVMGIAGWFKRIFKRKYDLAVFRNKIDQFFIEMKRLGKRGWIKIGFGSAMNIIFDMLTLYLFFNATMFIIKPTVLIVGYGLSYLLRKGIFIIPGGAGVVEGGMTVIYTNLGVPTQIAVVAVLGYRFISFWLPSLLGFAAMFYLQKVSAHQTGIQT